MAQAKKEPKGEIESATPAGHDIMAAVAEKIEPPTPLRD